MVWIMQKEWMKQSAAQGVVGLKTCDWKFKKNGGQFRKYCLLYAKKKLLNIQLLNSFHNLIFFQPVSLTSHLIYAYNRDNFF